MSKLTKEEQALLNELRAYKRLSKPKLIERDVQNRLEQVYWDSRDRVFNMCFDNGIGVSDLQLDE